MSQHFNADRLEALRIANGLTKGQFAERVGLSRQIINGWMTGRRSPNLISIQQIATEFGVDSKYFFEDAVHQNGDHR